MVDFITPILMVLAPGSGGFLGSWIAFYIYCPNRGCCQMKKVHRVCENPDIERD